MERLFNDDNEYEYRYELTTLLASALHRQQKKKKRHSNGAFYKINYDCTTKTARQQRRRLHGKPILVAASFILQHGHSSRTELNGNIWLDKERDVDEDFWVFEEQYSLYTILSISPGTWSFLPSYIFPFAFLAGLSTHNGSFLNGFGLCFW